MSSSNIKGVIDADRAKNAIKANVKNALKPGIKQAAAAKLDKNVSDLSTSDYSIDLDEAVDNVMEQINFTVDALVSELETAIDGIVDEIKSNAEINVTVVVPVMDLGEATVLPATFAQGAGAAAVPNPAPVPIKINKIKIPKGNIK